jgi:TOBE domain
VRLDPDSPLRLTVVAASYAGTHVRLELRGQGLELEAHVPPGAASRVGEVVGVTLHPDDLWRLPDAGRPEPTEREAEPTKHGASDAADAPAERAPPR